MQGSNNNFVKVQNKKRNSYEWCEKEISNKRNKNFVQKARKRKSEKLLNNE